MFARLRKAFRFFFQKEEFALTCEERNVLMHVLRSLNNTHFPYRGKTEMKPYEKANLAIWNIVMASPDRLVSVNEQNLQELMYSLSNKLLNQQEIY